MSVNDKRFINHKINYIDKFRKIYKTDNNIDGFVKRVATKMIFMKDEDILRMLKHINYFKDKIFNRCWIYQHIPYWETILYSKLNKIFSNNKTIRYLQIGVFEGMSMLYLTQNILEKFNVEITIIDNFSTEQYFDTQKSFDINTKNLKINKLVTDSHNGLLQLIKENKKFDFIYNSGSRKPDVLLVDLALLTKVIEYGSAILFDEYTAYTSYDGVKIMPNQILADFISANYNNFDITNIGSQQLGVYKEFINKYEIVEKKPDCYNVYNKNIN